MGWVCWVDIAVVCGFSGLKVWRFVCRDDAETKRKNKMNRWVTGGLWKGKGMMSRWIGELIKVIFDRRVDGREDAFDRLGV